MSLSRRYGSLALSVAVLSAVASVLLAEGSWRRLVAEPAAGLAVFCLAALTVQHRPWGKLGLGAGAATMAPAFLLSGPAGAILAAIVASLAGGMDIGRRQRTRGRRIDDLTRHAFAAALTVAMASWWEPASNALRLLTLAGLWIASLVLVLLLQQRLAGRRLVEPWRLAFAALLEGSFLALGALLALVAVTIGREAALLLLLTVALLTLESARQAKAREDAEVRVRAFERLGRAGKRLVTSPSVVDGVAPALFRECRQVLRFDGFELELLPRRTGEASEYWSAGPDGQLHPRPAKMPDGPPARPGIHRRVEWQRFEHRLDAGGVEALAFLRLWCDPRRISPDSEGLLRQLVPQLGGMVYRAVLGEQARTDPLTGAALRRVLDTRLEEAFARSRDGGASVAVVLCDLDFFKRVNDTYGHAAGDRALRAVADTLATGIREQDLCARYGGEEFALVIEDLSGQQVLDLADRIRRRVEALEVPADVPDRTLPLTLSAGIAVYPEVHCQVAEELTELADVALYEAKNLGRNGCLLYVGGGRYLDARGRSIVTREAGTVEAPHFFA